MNSGACKVWFDNENIFVQLNDNRIIGAPVKLYPRLDKATLEQRNKYELWNEGKWIHWEELDEDLSIEGFLKFEIAPAVAK